jgi:hypothetical protein
LKGRLESTCRAVEDVPSRLLTERRENGERNEAKRRK